jgi:hypothetical protein
MISKEEYKRRKLLKKIFFFLTLLLLVVLAGINFLSYFNKNFEGKKGKIINKKVEKVYFQLPYIYDPKAVLKAQYLNLTNYPAYELTKCLIKGECKDKQLLITAYIYKNANKSFCENLKNNLTIKNKVFYVENLNDLKKVCKVFYLMKEHKLKEKDCIDPSVSTICATYFEYEKNDFIKSNLELYTLLK